MPIHLRGGQAQLLQKKLNMIVRSVKTGKLYPEIFSSLEDIIDRYIPHIEERSIITITSKIVSITQGRVVKKEGTDKNKLIEKEADLFIPPSENKYDFYLTIKNNTLIPSAGNDGSNAGHYYILWPDGAQLVANQIRDYLTKKFNILNVGVLITDSTTAPLRWGVRGIAIAHSGFNALNDYIGKPDIFGRKLEVTKANVADALAAAAVIEMGEGNEQTPLAVITDVPYIEFQDRNPTHEEIDSMKISLEDDIFEPILKSVKWHKGKNR